ncbi:phosphodiester glycosidase family protein [Paenibacillus abyssi]|uniref:Rhodanese domain-containing protein n=1 Tax=Paenibacillus abyssi TaxID=1340531 RepID=A0A917CQZ4_9BACL|nr:phosphodiester glycosidase family protein [Paenibacillus abyssi]GGF94930.1 hypothetical protein GCM10010916_10410 [Paenibacillus abyssi]
MKKIVTLFVLVCIVFLVPTDWAAAGPKNFGYVDQQSNRTFVPIRFLSGYAGADVKWTSAEQRIDIMNEQKKVTLYVGKRAAYINDSPVVLEDVPFIDNGITYVPLRFVSEALGVQLQWNADIASVMVTYADRSTPLPVIKRGFGHHSSKPIVSERKTYRVAGRSFSVQQVTLSLMHSKIHLDVALAGNTIGKVENLNSIAKRNNAIVAINGTFFDAYTEADFKTPYGYIVSKGQMKRKSSGDRRTIFTYDKNNLAELIPGPGFNDRFALGTMEGGLQAGPRLLKDGKVALNVKEEGFKDPKILTGGGARSALGITRDHKLILLTTGGATIPQLAEIMKQAGAHQAMNLDGGASSGLYYNGKYLTTPGRQISNALIVKYQ